VEVLLLQDYHQIAALMQYQEVQRVFKEELVSVVVQSLVKEVTGLECAPKE